MHAVVDQLDTLIATRRPLDHPFDTAWSRGELRLDAMRQVCRDELAVAGVAALDASYQILDGIERVRA